MKHLQKGDYVAIREDVFDGGKMAEPDPDAVKVGQWSHKTHIQKVFEVNERGILAENNIFYPKRKIMGHATLLPMTNILQFFTNQCEWEVREIFWGTSSIIIGG